MSTSALVCPACGQSTDPWPADDDKTPVDTRYEKFAEANRVLAEAALDELRRRLDEEIARAKNLEAELLIARENVELIRIENSKLKMAVREIRDKNRKA